MDRVIDVIPLHFSNWALKYKSILGEKRFRRPLCVCTPVYFLLRLFLAPSPEPVLRSRDQKNEQDDDDGDSRSSLISSGQLTCVFPCKIGSNSSPSSYPLLLESSDLFVPVSCLVMEDTKTPLFPLSFCDPVVCVCLLSIDILPFDPLTESSHKFFPSISSFL